MADKIIFTGVGGFIAGVFLRSFVDWGIALPLFLMLVAVSLIVWGKFTVPKSFNKNIFFLTSFFLLAVIFGIARFELSVKEPDPILVSLASGNIVAEGLVVDEPDVREDKVFLEVDFKKIVNGDNFVVVKDRVRVSADFAPEAHYGDTLRISGKLSAPENFETDSGQVFDYVSYLEKEGIHFEMYRPKIEILSGRGGNPIKRFLFATKGLFLKRTAGLVPEPENSLLAGLILGAKHGLGEELTEDFRRAGLVHIIVLSGFNMTIVAFAIRWFLEHLRLPRKGASLGGIIGIAAFVVMTGGSATAVRAAIMAILGILADLFGRGYRINRALFSAAFIMIMLNPHIAAFDPSFQLSFMATLGLIYLSPIIGAKISFLPKFFGIKEIISATLATQIFVLPLLISMSGEVSIVSPLANILVLPFIPLTMLFGFISGATAFLSGLLALPFTYISLVFLKYEIFIAEVAGSLPFATLKVPAFLSGAILFLYIALVVWFVIIRPRRQNFSQSRSSLD